jgi:L-lactate dehydrogenase complex protein LldG
MTAREQILADIRRSTTPPAPYAPERLYRNTSTLTPHQLSELLEDRLRDYDAGVYHANPAELPTLIARILAERHKTQLAVPSGFPVEWLPQGPTFTTDSRTGITEIDACEGVLTTATLAIALTGTIVLQDAAGQGRRAVTLLPDYHLCIVNTADIVETVPEAMALLAPTARLATTFFSGPSATADIEMTRIKGVHGPRFVDVILLD